MSAQIYEIRDYQSKAAIERAHKALEEHLNQQAIEIANIAFPFVLGSDAGTVGFNPIYLAPEKDPA